MAILEDNVMYAVCGHEENEDDYYLDFSIEDMGDTLRIKSEEGVLAYTKDRMADLAPYFGREGTGRVTLRRVEKVIQYKEYHVCMGYHDNDNRKDPRPGLGFLHDGVVSAEPIKISIKDYCEMMEEGIFTSEDCAMAIRRYWEVLPLSTIKRVIKRLNYSERDNIIEGAYDWHDEQYIIKMGKAGIYDKRSANKHAKIMVKSSRLVDLKTIPMSLITDECIKSMYKLAKRELIKLATCEKAPHWADDAIKMYAYMEKLIKRRA